MSEQEEREVLTDEQIMDWVFTIGTYDITGYRMNVEQMLRFARAIERAALARWTQQGEALTADMNAQAFIAYRATDPGVGGFTLFYAGWQSALSAQQAGTGEPTREEAADELLQTAHAFWQSERDAGMPGAVKWLTADDGSLLIFSRGEYRDALMKNIEHVTNNVHNFAIPKTAPATFMDAWEQFETGAATPESAPASAVSEPQKATGSPHTHEVVAAACATCNGRGYIVTATNRDEDAQEPCPECNAPEAGKPVAPVAQPVAFKIVRNLGNGGRLTEFEAWSPTPYLDNALSCEPLYTHPSPAANGAAERDALQALLDHVDCETCRHEETHRGGAIWTICDGCGRKWADDRGGFEPYEDAPAVAAARAALSTEKKESP